ncbi:MAG: hypothetical protein KME07_16185 [Pegethrix bostrychoides GSE-TBD4-15B]|jgi:hypothetical protein|uniref:Uncharacterized protein n=1 Tax=Pegethrix bostrychoides GSE-TBD4-15B TaxID=2839662 RepID=A0A951U5N6_9CYAN|nr:hypothetical protein [Pegethrix bostrychoides GSE-TBD4-15B]
MDQVTERIESLKAGLAGAAAATSAFGLAATGRLWLSLGLDLGLDLAPATALGSQATVALLSGFLFGVTYRYVIRADRNSHLQSGAVLAFGLVRGLAPIQSLRLDWQAALQIGLQLTESLLLFSLAALLIDWLMRRGWIQRFS